MKLDKKMHTIRICEYYELSKLKKFIKYEWKKNHIFTYNDDLLKFQHYNSTNHTLNFIVAYNNQTQEFDGILGFIPISQYDENIVIKDIWLAIWKVKKEHNSTGIGIKLFLYLTNLYNISSIGILGFSNNALKIYKAFRYTIGELDHYYIKNDLVKSFFISKFLYYESINTQNINNNFYIKEIDVEKFRQSNLVYKYMPTKSINYFINRYYMHKFYDYKIYGIFKKNIIISAFVSREIIVNTSKCLRIIDWMGEYPTNLYTQFQEILYMHNYEYIDLVCKVYDSDNIINMGFKKKNSKEVLIPNYFEPFEKENTIINYAYKTKEQHYAFFKGDSDQDRPNILKNLNE